VSGIRFFALFIFSFIFSFSCIQIKSNQSFRPLSDLRFRYNLLKTKRIDNINIVVVVDYVNDNRKEFYLVWIIIFEFSQKPKETKVRVRVKVRWDGGQKEKIKYDE